MLIAKVIRRWACVVAALAVVSGASVDAAAQSATDKPRLIVLTDIGNEPDDSMSMVRLLTYANEFDIEGLVATTSTHLRNATHREMIEARINAYSEVLPNLRVHADGYPDPSQLMSRVRSGSAVYGMSGVGEGKETEASRLIIEAVDRPDPRPVWVTVWGGAADLAQALWTVRATRMPAEVERFVSKLRVYSISDQDDAGPWARAYFPQLFWVTSVHSFGEYRLATWAGITTGGPGIDQTQVSQPWLDEHIRNHGALGALYPRIVFGMEGDTPSFLYLIPNGLGASEHPDWGSWGGRYGRVADSLGLFTSAIDTYVGEGGITVASNQATVSRWRSAFQNDFAARMDWSTHARFADANHAPQLRVNGEGGTAPLEISTCASEPIPLSARGTRDPDRHQTLTYRWWQYRELGMPLISLQLSASEGRDIVATAQPWSLPSNFPIEASYQVHLVLEVTDSGAPALTRYRRVIVNVLTGGVHNGRECAAPRQMAAVRFTDEATGPAPPPGMLSTAHSSIGDLIDNPAARAILDRRLPGFSGNPQLEQARGFTLPMLQAYLPSVTNEVLAAIDGDLARLPPN